jgi:hypothetical protein
VLDDERESTSFVPEQVVDQTPSIVEHALTEPSPAKAFTSDNQTDSNDACDEMANSAESTMSSELQDDCVSKNAADTCEAVVTVASAMCELTTTVPSASTLYDDSTNDDQISPNATTSIFQQESATQQSTTIADILSSTTETQETHSEMMVDSQSKSTEIDYQECVDENVKVVIEAPSVIPLTQNAECRSAPAAYTQTKLEQHASLAELEPRSAAATVRRSMTAEAPKSRFAGRPPHFAPPKPPKRSAARRRTGELSSSSSSSSGDSTDDEDKKLVADDQSSGVDKSSEQLIAVKTVVGTGIVQSSTSEKNSKAPAGDRVADDMAIFGTSAPPHSATRSVQEVDDYIQCPHCDCEYASMSLLTDHVEEEHEPANDVRVF